MNKLAVCHTLQYYDELSFDIESKQVNVDNKYIFQGFSSVALNFMAIEEMEHMEDNLISNHFKKLLSSLKRHEKKLELTDIDEDKIIRFHEMYISQDFSNMASQKENYKSMIDIIES